MHQTVFFSHNFPANALQVSAVSAVQSWLDAHFSTCLFFRPLAPRLPPPMHEIRSCISAADKIVVLAFLRYESRIDDAQGHSRQRGHTSAWVHMEAAMAIQIGKPVLLLKQSNIDADGVFDTSLTGIAVHEFDLQPGLADLLNLLPTLQF